MAFNKVILVGNMVADPELKKTASGISVTSFSIAVNRRFTKQGEQARTDFFNVTAWRNTAEFVCNYFQKGRQILVCGQLQNRSWTDKDGQKRTSTEIIADEVSFVGNKGTDGGIVPPSSQSNSDIPSYSSSQDEAFSGINSDDELPF